MTESNPPDLHTGEPTFPPPGGAYHAAPATAPPVEPRQTYAQWQAEQNPWGPPPGQYPGYYPAPAQASKSVRGLGIATQVMLAIQLVASAVLLVPALHERSLIQRIVNDPGSVSAAEADRADTVLNALSVVNSLLYLATGIVWIIWFYRARQNVEAWSPSYQRRGRGWAIGGWICPVVNLWFPYLMAKDILDDTERDRSGSTGVRPSRPLLVVWGLGFAAMIIFGFVVRGASGSLTTVDDYTFLADVLIIDVVITVAATVPAFLVVQKITSAQTARRQRP